MLSEPFHSIPASYFDWDVSFLNKTDSNACTNNAKHSFYLLIMIHLRVFQLTLIIGFDVPCLDSSILVTRIFLGMTSQIDLKFQTFMSNQKSKTSFFRSNELCGCVKKVIREGSPISGSHTSQSAFGSPDNGHS